MQPKQAKRGSLHEQTRAFVVVVVVVGMIQYRTFGWRDIEWFNGPIWGSAEAAQAKPESKIQIQTHTHTHTRAKQLNSLN